MNLDSNLDIIHMPLTPCSFMVGSGRVKPKTVLPIVVNKFKPKYTEQRLLGLHKTRYNGMRVTF